MGATVEGNDLEPVTALRPIHVLYQRRCAGEIGVADAARGVDQNCRCCPSPWKIDRRLTKREQDGRKADGLQNQSGPRARAGPGQSSPDQRHQRPGSQERMSKHHGETSSSFLSPLLSKEPAVKPG